MDTRSTLMTRVLAFACGVLGSICCAAEPNCDVILKGGVFDRDQQASFSLRHSIFQSTVCSQGQSANLSELTFEQKSMCDKRYESLLSVDSYQREVQTASALIANAWTRCLEITSNAGGLVHYFEPTNDPERYVYHVTYRPNSSEVTPRTFVTVRKWAMAPASAVQRCREENAAATHRYAGITSGRKIDVSGITLLCERDRGQQITVVMTANEVALAPGQRNKAVSLPADPVAWHLAMGEADDQADCWLYSPSGAQTFRQTTYPGNPVAPAVTGLNQFLKDGDNRLVCKATDLGVNSNFQPCWHAYFQVFQNGNSVRSERPSCCSGTCSGKPPFTHNVLEMTIPFTQASASALAAWQSPVTAQTTKAKPSN